MAEPNLDKNYNPEEAEIQSIDAEIKRLNNASRAASGVQSWQNVYDALGAYEDPLKRGSWARSQVDSLLGEGITQEIDRAGRGGYGGIADQHVKNWDDGFDINQVRSALQGSIEGKVREKTARQGELQSAARERRIGRLKTREEELKAELSGIKSEYDMAIDRQLGNMLSELGYRADTARQGAGAAYAERGLTRSTFANDAVNEVTLNQLEGSGEQRLAAANQKEALRTGIEKTQDDITRQRRGLAQRQDLTELSAVEDMGFSFDEAAFKRDLEGRLFQMELDGEHKAFTSQLIGGLVGGVTQLLAKSAASGGGS